VPSLFTFFAKDGRLYSFTNLQPGTLLKVNYFNLKINFVALFTFETVVQFTNYKLLVKKSVQESTEKQNRPHELLPHN